MPPRLLSGITLLFWGAMTGHAVLGLVAAFLLEARSWVHLRWDFTKTTYVRSWHYTILCGALIAILAWMNGMKVGKIHTLFVWAPLILLPIELAMRYGKAEKIPLNTFSFFARKKLAQDIKLGRITQPRMINTGAAYISTVLLATAMGSQHELHHFIGLCIIIAAALIINGRRSGFRPVAWTSGIVLVITFSLLGQWGMLRFYDYYRGGRDNNTNNRNISANETRTSIGRLGKLKLSPQIFWRMQVHQGEVPGLLRLATYNQYSNANWRYKFNPDENDSDSERDKKGYLTAESISTEGLDLDLRIFKGTDSPSPNQQAPLQQPTFPETANLTIVGEIDARTLENPIPMPHFIHAVGGITDIGKEASLESNPLGTVRLANPEFNVIEYQIWVGNSSTTENVHNAYDLDIPRMEQAAIKRTCQSLGLYQPDLTTAQKIRRLRDFFNTQFTYTTHLQTPHVGRNHRSTAVGQFLESTQSGHCEYFATATALILREVGVPTRYCVGFSVHEEDETRDEWVMRGKHAHAWCRIWIDGHWEDLDLTPPSWESMEETNSGHWQRRLADWWQRLREDFLIWRTHKTNQSRVINTITTIITFLTLWIIWRLWKSRNPHRKLKRLSYRQPKNAPVTPLHKLEPRLSKILGPRPLGTPLTRWLKGLTQTHPSLEPLIEEITRLHSAIRFDPLSAENSETKNNQAQLETLCQQLKQKM